jgi:glycosylphosphatidylinositol transamidase (GPIT) subunit GPI8
MALDAIKSGPMPWITGASGGLEYDVVMGVDPISSYYSNWIIDNGSFRTIGILNSVNSTKIDKSDAQSISLSHASAGLMSVSSGGSGNYAATSDRDDFRAVVVGPSYGWQNYRHQADALTLYSLLRQNGVDDDHIILMIYDDIPNAPENPIRGDVHNIPQGRNIRSGATVDYSGTDVTAGTLMNVLTGTTTASSPYVLDSGPGTDIFVYIASHGSPGKISFRWNDSFTTDDFTEITNTMYRDRKYREMVFFVDTCFGESIAANATAPGIYYLTGAAKNEPSLGAVYDMNIRQWLSDEFTQSVITALQSDTNITFRELYPATYARVTGSHVRLVDTGEFSLDTPVMRFLHL